MDIEEEEELKSLTDYLHIIIRRRYFIVFPMIILFTASIVLSIILPPVYQSKATILIEQQHIPEDLVRSTVVSYADERINKIQKKIMTIDNINQIIEKFNLYTGKKQSLGSVELFEIFSDNTLLELISADVISKGRKSKATLAFTLSFDHKNPSLTQKVVNELVTMFLDMNIRARTQRAGETTKFLEEEAEKFKLEIQKIENQIAEYKEKYSDSLPELLQVNMTSITRFESELQQLAIEEKMLNERKINLRMQMTITSPIILDDNANSLEALPENLTVLESEYQKLLDRYSASHPDVKAIKRKIDSFQIEESAVSNELNINNPVYLQLKSEMDMADIELYNIKKQRENILEKLKNAEIRVSQTHQVERGYYDLMRDLDNHKAKYRELKAKYLDAKLAQTLEEEQQSEKFTLIEPARIPKKPIKPNRIKIIVFGLILSIAAGLGCGLIAEALDSSIRGPKALVGITGAEPLVVIPYVKNDEDVAKSKKMKIMFAVMTSLLFLIIVIAIHFLYMPLDLLYFKVLHRISMII